MLNDEDIRKNLLLNVRRCCGRSCDAVSAAFNTWSTLRAMAPDCSVRFANIGMEGSFQRDLMHPIDQENRGRGSKSKIRNPRLPSGPTMVRSEYSLLSVVRRSGSAAQAKHTTKNRKMMATNATALCTRVISISNAQQCSPRLREINNPLSLSVTVLRHRVQSFRD